MRSPTFTAILLVSGALLGLASPTHAEVASSSSPTNAAREQVAQPSGQTRSIIWKPKKLKSKAGAVRAGATRSAGDEDMFLSVLAPEDIGFTTREQPTLFWYQSKPATVRFELTVREKDVKTTHPLFATQIDRAEKSGIQSLKLSDYSAKLAKGTNYLLSVALVQDEEERSKDIFASTIIRRIDPPARVTNAPTSELAAIYAEEGIWYDALEELSNQMTKNPSDRILQEMRGDLLNQVDLTNAAIHELQRVRTK